MIKINLEHNIMNAKRSTFVFAILMITTTIIGVIFYSSIPKADTEVLKSLDKPSFVTTEQSTTSKAVVEDSSDSVYESLSSVNTKAEVGSASDEVYIESNDGKTTVANGMISLLVPEGMIVKEGSDGPGNQKVFIAEPSAFNDDNHGRTALYITVNDINYFSRFLGKDPTLQEFIEYYIFSPGKGSITEKTIGAHNLLVAYSEFFERNSYVMMLDETHVVSVSGPSYDGFSGEELEEVIESMEFNVQ